MTLAAYFEQHDGIGILATCDPDNLVDLAVYSKPVVIDETTVAFVMRQRISHKNLRANLNAAYMFIEKGPGYQGKRLYLRMLKEERDIDKINALRRSHHGGDEASATLVYFTVEHIRPLVGDHE